MDYYILLNCANCAEEIYYGLCRTYIEHNGHPVVTVGEGEQQSFECDKCGKKTYTGELEIISEDDI